MRASGLLVGMAVVPLLAGGLLYAQNSKPGDAGYPYGDLKEVTLQGKLIDLGAELSRKYGARTAGSGPEKQWALALPKGELYTFLDNDGYRRLIAAPPAEGAVEVQARLFPRSHLIELRSFHALRAASIRQRFFCPVCTIYTDDWGPCACCGREMQPVKDGA